MKRWVITLEYFEGARKPPHAKKIIALISARKNAKFIKQYIEDLYFMFCLDLKEQQHSSSYNNRCTTFKAKSTYDCDVYLVSSPYIFRGQRSEIIQIRKDDANYWLKWQGIKYPRYKECPETHKVLYLGQEEPPVMEAQQANFEKIWD